MSAPLAPPSLSVFRGQTCQKAHKAGVVLKECTSPSPPLFFQPRTTFSGNPGRSNILSLGLRRLFPQGEVIDYSATCDACRCACDVARDVSFASIKTKKQDEKVPQSLFLPLAPESVSERGSRVGRTVEHHKMAFGY